MNRLRYILYARKSSEAEDRQIASIDDQINFLREYAKNHHLLIIKEYKESKSAKNPSRPEFNKMLQDFSDKNAEGILCWKLDRLSRNPVDTGSIQYMLQNNIIKEIVTNDRVYLPTDNVLMMAVDFGMANQFLRDLSVNTKRGLKGKAERGWYPCKPPIGYKSNPLKIKGNKEIIKDEERFYQVRKLFDLMLTGSYTPPELVKYANKELRLTNKYNQSLSRSNMYRILKDTFYYGEFEYPKNSGNYYKGQHEPLISKEEYIKIQGLLNKKNNVRPKTKEFKYTGIFNCGECGALVTAEEKNKIQKNKNKHHYIYYHCTHRKTKYLCNQSSIEEKNLEAQISNLLSQIELPQELISWCLKVLNRKFHEEIFLDKKVVENKTSQLVKCENKIKNLLDLRINDEINSEEFQLKNHELKKEKDNLEIEIEKLKIDKEDISTKLNSLFDFSENLRLAFLKGNVKTKKEILLKIGSNLRIENKNVNILLKKPFSTLKLIKESLKGVIKINDRLEPVQLYKNKRTYSKISTISPLLLREQDSNLQPFG